MGGYVVIRVARPRSKCCDRWNRGAARPPPLTPVSSMRGFWGLMRAYWVSERWKEAWGLTPSSRCLTALSSKASVWLAEASGELVNSIALFHDPENTTPLTTLLTSAALLVLLVLLKDAGFTGIRHLFSTTLHRKWRGWLDGRFNDALLDGNHTHFHLQHGAGVPGERQRRGARQYRPARAGIHQGDDRRRHRPCHGHRRRRHVAVLRRPEAAGNIDQGQRPGIPRRLWQRRAGLRGYRDLRALEHPHCAEARPPARAADRQDAAGGRQLSRRTDHAVPPQLPCRGVARRGRAEGDARPALPRHRPHLGEPQQDQCRLHVVRADLQFRGGPHRRLRPEPCALHAELDQPEGLCDGCRTGQLADQPMLVVHPCDAGDRDAEGQCKAGDRSRGGDRERAEAARLLPPHRPFRLPLRHPERGVRADGSRTSS